VIEFRRETVVRSSEGLLNLELIHFSVAFTAALVVGSFAEYIVHRLMHDGKVLKIRHAKHHRNADGQGWAGEFWDYFAPGIAIIWLGFLHSIAAGFGFAFGCFAYASFAAYAHQVQHENAELVFWLPRPVHHLHHRENMWQHNFGISLDIWDRVLGTYKKVEWSPERRARDYPVSAFLNIRWR
jgi:sterol desaturase/sphingolipid hydroxylase (fatty acid hydroxylase superfamily)